jgi:hypothetical protein
MIVLLILILVYHNSGLKYLNYADINDYENSPWRKSPTCGVRKPQVYATTITNRAARSAV